MTFFLVLWNHYHLALRHSGQNREEREIKHCMPCNYATKYDHMPSSSTTSVVTG